MNPLSSSRLINNRPTKHWRQRYKSALSLSLISLLVSCQLTACSPNQEVVPLPESAIEIDDSVNLYQVDNLLFRSEQLGLADIPLLIDNDIDAIINLRYFNQTANDELLDKIVEDTSVTLYNQPLKAWNVTPQEIAQALSQIKVLQDQNKRVLVHCYHGADRTGLIVAMYRIIEQGWSIEDAKQEMTAGGYGYHPIWINLEKMLDPITLNAVREQL